MNLHSTPGRVGATCRRRWRRRALLVVGVFLAVAGTATAGRPASVLAVDPELAWLLRGMALIKGLIVVAAALAVWWRFARPLSNRMVAGYLCGVWVAAAGSMLVWQLTALGMAAGAFHVGELVLLGVAWRDYGRQTAARARRTDARQ